MKLREAREAKKLSQTQLAEKTGLTQTQVSHLELGKCAPRNSTMRAIEQVVGRVDWLNTRGLRAWREGQMRTWEAVEQNYRKALFGIKSLPVKERAEFVKLAESYLKEFKREIK